MSAARRLVPEVPSPEVSRRMALVRTRDTDPEIALRRLLHRRGLRYRLDVRPLPTLRRRADIVFPRDRVAVFVDGCFWHGCPRHPSWPKTNAMWWREKIERNRERDRETSARLRAAGWTVVRVWEHEEASKAAERVRRAVLTRRS